MNSPPTLEEAFVLHSRPYRDTSRIVEFLTAQHGRVSLIARGTRRGHSSRHSQVIQSFAPMLIAWRGRGELPTLTHSESDGPPILLSGGQIIHGLYLNELLIRTLERGEAVPRIYARYNVTLLQIQSQLNIERDLRLFEKELLDELGYGLIFDRDCDGKVIDPFARYRYDVECGPRRVPENSPNGDEILGASLISLGMSDLKEEQCLADAKKLMRQILIPYIGAKPLHSRQLARSLYQLNSRNRSKRPIDKED